MEVVAHSEIVSKIYIIREEKVMIDSDLAELYDVETKYLKRQVRRNIDRFPEDFMFEITKDEYADLRSQIGTKARGTLKVSSNGIYGARSSAIVGSNK